MVRRTTGTTFSDKVSDCSCVYLCVHVSTVHVMDCLDLQLVVCVCGRECW